MESGILGQSAGAQLAEKEAGIGIGSQAPAEMWHFDQPRRLFLTLPDVK